MDGWLRPRRPVRERRKTDGLVVLALVPISRLVPSCGYLLWRKDRVLGRSRSRLFGPRVFSRARRRLAVILVAVDALTLAGRCRRRPLSPGFTLACPPSMPVPWLVGVV